MDSGEAAIRAGLDRFHVVCADFAGPGMNGVELLEKVRELSPAAGCVLFAGIGQGGGEWRTRLDAIGGVRIGAPFEPEHLKALVANLAETAALKKRQG